MPDMSHLDEHQCRAVLSGPGLVRVTAGAGTGKTTVLTLRIARLIEEGADPSSVVATTFTNKAAGEMRERLHGLLGVRAAGVTLRTIDSVAARLCRRNAEAAGVVREFLIADDDETKVLMRNSAVEAGLMDADVEIKDAREVLRELSRRISSWKAAGLLPTEAPRSDDWVRAWQAYERMMAERGILDFQDIVLRASRALADPEVLTRESGAVRWLLVDEFQDTGAAQAQFLRLLSMVHRNVFVVGDPDQSIYSFRKSVPDAMERVRELLPEAAAVRYEAVALVENRRCTDEVLAPACQVVDYNRREEPKVLRSGRSGEAVGVSVHASCKAEAQAVLESIRLLRMDGAEWAHIGVMARNARVLEPLASLMPAAGVPFSMRGSARFSERSEVKDVMAYVKLAVNPTHDLAFLRIVSRPSRGLGPNAAARTLAMMRNPASGGTIHGALLALANSGELRPSASTAARTMSDHLRALEAIHTRGRLPVDAVEYVLGPVGYSDWAHSQKDASKTLTGSLHGLLLLAERHVSVAEFACDAMLDSEADGDVGGDTVTLATIHGAKGLEWEHVYVLGVEDGILPSVRALKDVGRPNDPWDWRASGGVEEERRLLHVAMTRSKKTLSLSHAATRVAGGGRTASRPSRMLREAGLEAGRIAPAAMAPRVAPGGKPPSRKKSLGLW